jgi:hypothetical protein
LILLFVLFVSCVHIFLLLLLLSQESKSWNLWRGKCYIWAQSLRRSLSSQYLFHNLFFSFLFVSL